MAAGIAAALRRRVELVGVFVNPTLDEVAHAAERPAPLARPAPRRRGPRLLRGGRAPLGLPRDQGRPRRLGRRPAGRSQRFHTDFHLLDAAARGLRGGSGQAWDWALAARLRGDVPVILSGGLTADTVAAGIAAVRPYAVDVASGVEASPGVKDPERLAAFLAAAAADPPAPAAEAPAHAPATAAEPPAPAPASDAAEAVPS